MSRLIFLILCFLFALDSHADLYKYNELEIKDYDEMQSIVAQRLLKVEQLGLTAQKEAKEENGNPDDAPSIAILEDTLRLIFSRPNKDNIVEKLVPEVRKALNNHDAYYETIHSLVDEAISGMNQKIPVVYKSTYIFILENIMSELRPEIKKHKQVKKLFLQIKDANIIVPNEVRLDRKLRSMIRSQSPSKTAALVLAHDFPNERTKKTKGFWGGLFGG